MVKRVPHVYEEVAMVSERVAAFRRASESERLTAIAVLTRRRVSHSGEFAATVAALVVASLVGALAVYTAWAGMFAQAALAQRQAAAELIDLFKAEGLRDQEMSAVRLARDSLGLVADTPNLLPGAIVVLLSATALVLVWASWRTRRGSVAQAWLAVYLMQDAPASTEPETSAARPSPLLTWLTHRRTRGQRSQHGSRH